MIPLDHLPEIGEQILIQTEGQWVPATIISMVACHRLQPNLWTDAYGKVWPEKDVPYGPDDTIRAYRFNDGDGAGFCIMRFTGPGGYTYSKNVSLPDAGLRMGCDTSADLTPSFPIPLAGNGET